MNSRFVIAGPRSANPLAQLLYLVVGVVLIIGAIFMGAIILSAVFGLALVLGIVFWVRVWWLRWKMRHAARKAGLDPGRQDGGRAREGGGVEITDVEYTVVRESRREDRREDRQD